MSARGLFINPVKCWAAIDMAYLGKQGLYRLCSFSTLSGGILQLLLERCRIILIVNVHPRREQGDYANKQQEYANNLQASLFFTHKDINKSQKFSGRRKFAAISVALENGQARWQRRWKILVSKRWI